MVQRRGLTPTSFPTFAQPTDPADANAWGRECEARALLIQRLSANRQAVEQVDSRGIRILVARAVGRYALSYLHLPFAIVMRRCAIPEPAKLVAPSIFHLDLSGSCTGEISHSVVGHRRRGTRAA